jgi:3-deoxy-D-manno-octulosonic-acid transferase
LRERGACGILSTSSMPNGYDIAYSLGLTATAPLWLVAPKARRKVLRALRERMGDVPERNPSHWAVMIHAVSLGEMNATRSLVEHLRLAAPDLQFIISTTTDTGYTRAGELYGNASDVTLIKYPLDFSSGVTRVLDRLKPALVVLMELEVWPNFLRQCELRAIPVIIANGRMSDSSFRNYRWARPFISGMFQRITRICAQDDEYARRFVDLGAVPENVIVTGTMKFDNAAPTDSIPGDVELAEAVGLYPGPESIWVCGSTGPGEEETILRVYRQLLTTYARLRLVIVPRKPERFNDVAALIESMKFRIVRRSSNIRPAAGGIIPSIVLGDTTGELRKFYSLADVVFVGRSLVDLGSKQHGSDMIEPAALARPVVVGQFTGNFADVMRRFRESDAMLIAANEADLYQHLMDLLAAPTKAAMLGKRAQDVVRREQGSTQRHIAVILDVLRTVANKSWPAILK